MCYSVFFCLAGARRVLQKTSRAPHFIVSCRRYLCKCGEKAYPLSHGYAVPAPPRGRLCREGKLSGKTAKFPVLHKTLSVCSRWSQPAPPKGGALYGLTGSCIKPPPPRGRWHRAAMTERVPPPTFPPYFTKKEKLQNNTIIQTFSTAVLKNTT